MTDAMAEAMRLAMADVKTEIKKVVKKEPAKKRWLKMGVELEGGWASNYRLIAESVPGAAGKTDGSVKETGEPNQGEITTRPHETLEKLTADIKKLYPNAVNDTCGFHIHTSFTPMDLSVLADLPFWKYFRRRWEDWGTQFCKDDKVFWSRFNGRSREHNGTQFCKAEFKPVSQIQDHNDRYTQLNFTAWHKYKTLECRLLPMFKDAELACLAVYELADIYNSYLEEAKFPEIKMAHEVLVDVAGVRELYQSLLPERSLLVEEKLSNHPKLPVGEDIQYYIDGAEGLMLPYKTDTGLLVP